MAPEEERAKASVWQKQRAPPAARAAARHANLDLVVKTPAYTLG